MTAMEDKSDNTIDDLVMVNNLKYYMPADLSCTNQRRYTKQFFTNQSYGSNNPNAVCIFQTGGSFVSDAFLHFKVSITNSTNSGGDTSLTSGGDLLNSIVIFTRDGTEVQRITNLNLLTRHLSKFTTTSEKYSTYDELWRKPHDFSGGTIEYTIPMEALSDLFRYGKRKSLLPSVLCAGLRIEIQLENNTSAFITKTGTTMSYTLSDMYINVCENTLSDSVALAVNENAAKNGLEIPFNTWFTSKFDVSSRSFNLEVRKACSRALRVLMITQTNPNVSNVDSFSSETNFNISKVQTRVGSIYMPNSVCTSQQEMYIYTCESFSNFFPSSDSCSVSLTEYISGGSGVFCQSLERSFLEDSGMSINNSRTCMLNGEFATSVEKEGRQVTTFLQHVCVIRLFLNNSVLEM